MKAPKYISLSQAQKLANFTNTFHERALILVLTYTGARISEILRLTPADVNLQEKWLAIPHLKRNRKPKIR